jgi:hypothetical protein
MVPLERGMVTNAAYPGGTSRRKKRERGAIPSLSDKDHRAVTQGPPRPTQALRMMQTFLAVNQVIAVHLAVLT